MAFVKWHLSNPTRILREYIVSVPIIPDIAYSGLFNSISIEISNDLYDLGETKIYATDSLCPDVGNLLYYSKVKVKSLICV